VIVLTALFDGEADHVIREHWIGVAIAPHGRGRPLLRPGRRIFERIDGARVVVEVIRVRAVLVVVGILRRDDTQAARHVENVTDADLLPRIAGCLPLGNRRRLVQRVHALLHQQSE
jgi:hypothetical protein